MKFAAHKSQQGIALITALLMVALVTIIGAGLVTQMNVAVHRSGNLWLDEQAWWYVIGVENWIGQILQLDAQNSEIDALTEAWAQPVDYLPIEGGALQGKLQDLQGRFNLNNLAEPGPAVLARCQRLIQFITELDPVTAATIAQSTRDWIDADTNVTLPYGAEDDFYLGQIPAYRTANQPMVSPSELLLVNGVTPELYAALEPHITALPETTALNVNTATLANLAALAPNIKPADLEALLAKRLEAPWGDVQAFRQENATAGLQINNDDLTVTTRYFQASGLIAVDRGQLKFRSTFVRTSGGQTRLIAHNRDTN